MAIHWIEGFETYRGSVNGDISAFLTEVYSPATVSVLCTLQKGRYHGFSTRFEGNASNRLIGRIIASAQVTLCSGVAFMTNLATNNDIIELRDGTTIHVTLRIKTDGSVAVTRNGTDLGTPAAAGTILPGRWYYAELKASIANSGGAYEARINGTNVHSGTDDTQNAGNASVDRVVLRGGGSNHNVWFDDWYIADDFLGEQVVEALFPTSSIENDWTPNSGSNHDAAGQYSSSGDTLYNESNTQGHRDRYGLSAPRYVDTQIVAMQVRSLVRVTTGSNDIELFLRSGGSETAFANKTISSTSYAVHTNLSELDPLTSVAWTTLTNVSAGIEVK